MGQRPSKKKEDKEKDRDKERRSTVHVPATRSPSSTNQTGQTLSNSHSSHDILNPPQKSNDTSHSKSTSTVSTSKKQNDDEKGFSMKLLEELYNKYQDQDDPEHIGPDNMMTFCKDINVDPENVVMLIMAWHLEAQTMGYFSKQEFLKGFQKLKADSIVKIQNLTSYMLGELEDPEKFREIYRFAFTYAKEKRQKVLDIQTASLMLMLTVGDKSPHTKNFIKFLEEQTSWKGINADQWMVFLDFSQNVSSDLSNYDENAAWPVIYDEFVEWLKNKD